MASPARRVALEALLDVEPPGGPSLAERLAAPDVAALEARERDFLHELLLGSLRRRGRLDHALAPLLERPLDEAHPVARGILRLGAHQILHLRVPARAAVHQAVELARARRPGAAGLVNAVLRRLAEAGGPPAPDAREQPLAWLSTEGSLPPWLAKRWLAELGSERALARAQALSQAPPAAFRLHPRRAGVEARLAEAGIHARPLAVPGALECLRGRLEPLARQGLVYPQDTGSQLAGRLAAELASPGPLLDACAAPGGKTLQLADGPGQTAPVVALEPSARRLRTLRLLVERWGAGGAARLVRADAARPPLRGAFGAVLVDAPCSGLGTLAGNPDIRWRARPGDLPRQAQRQRALLEALAPLVAPGGALIYAVCSLEPEEAAEQAAGFLAAHPEFSPAALPEWCAPFRIGPAAALLPERDGGDGFYAAPFRRRREVS